MNKAMDAFVTKHNRNILSNLNAKNPLDAKNPFLGLSKAWTAEMQKALVLATPETVNLAAEVSQVNHINTVVPGRGEVTDEQRHLATPMFGRVCPYETPAGKKLGVVNTRAIGVRYNDGVAEFPVYKVINTSSGIAVNMKRIIWLSPEEELNYKLGDILSLTTRQHPTDADIRIIENTTVLARVPNVAGSAEPFKFLNIHAHDLVNHYVTVYPEQFISPTVGLIPFVNSDDAVRISYGASQIRQAVYLLNSEKPLVKTPMYDDMLGYSAVQQFVSPTHGTIKFINNMRCDIERRDGSTETVYMQGPNTVGSLDVTMDVMGKAGDKVEPGTVIAESHNYPQVFVVRAPYDCEILKIEEDFITLRKLGEGTGNFFVNFETEQIDKIEMAKMRITNTSAVIMSLHVSEGDILHKGDIIADTQASRGGTYTPSRNALVAYMSTGYNYEDGVHATERASINYISVAVHNTLKRLSKQHVSHCRVKRVSGYKFFDNGQTMAHINCTKSRADGNPDSKIPVKANHKENGFLLEYERAEDTPTTIEYKFSTLSLNKLQVGDKTAGLHGNKGVVSKVDKDSMAPQLKNGLTVEFILNPCGVPSRMNLGQIYNAQLGLAAKVLGITINVEAFNSATPEDVALMLSLAYDLANDTRIGDRTNQYPNQAVFKEIWERYSDKLPIHKFGNIYNQVWSNIRNIMDWRGVFDKDGAAQLYDPVTDTYFDGKVLIGYPMFNKQEQEADEKINARGGTLTEKYASINAQPQKNEESAKGQRMGEMELVNFAAYGCSALLDEVLNEKSDNAGRRAVNLLNELDIHPTTVNVDMDSRAVMNMQYLFEGDNVGIEYTGPGAPNSSKSVSACKTAISIAKEIRDVPAFNPTGSQQEKAESVSSLSKVED